MKVLLDVIITVMYTLEITEIKKKHLLVRRT